MKYRHTQQELDDLAEFFRDVEYMEECVNEWYQIGAMIYAEAMGML